MKMLTGLNIKADVQASIFLKQLLTNICNPYLGVYICKLNHQLVTI